MRNFLPIFAVLFVYPAIMRAGVCAQKAPTPFSTYGQIQNVQNYSTNPYWTPDGPYNLRMPTPIYATGSAVKTNDCQNVVTNLIAAFCVANDCANKKIRDVRPIIMVQLSQLPGHNFATSCGGYIDSEFEKYKNMYGNVFVDNTVNTVSKSNTGVSYGKTVFPDAPSVNNTQSSNISTSKLNASYFPTTATDASFVKHVASTATGYEPYKDSKAYRGLVVEGEEKFLERQFALFASQQQKDEKNMTPTEYCKKYPNDGSKCSISVSTGSGSGSGIGSSRWPSDNGLDGTLSRPPVGGEFSGQTIGGGAVSVGNKTHGGSCYPAAKSKVFKNKVLTTGKYESISPAFEKSLISIFRKEGECGEIENDPCGYTCYGIGSKCMGIDVRNLTRADAEDIYYNSFWKKYNIGKLPDVISGDIMLAAMGSGPCTAIQQFRQFLGLSKVCKIDDNLVSAVENYNGDIHNDWLDKRAEFLREVSARRYNDKVLNAWMNGIRLKRENGCHVVPAEPIYR